MLILESYYFKAVKLIMAAKKGQKNSSDQSSQLSRFFKTKWKKGGFREFFCLK